MEPAFHQQREHLSEQFGSTALGKAGQARAVVMAREEPPQLAVDDDRDRQRGAHAHVLQVFDVDRRHRAEQRQRQVERFGLAHRFDRARHVVDVGDDAEDVAHVQRSRLLRYVGRREIEPEEAVDPLLQRFCHHFARTAGRKAIDHDAVETGQQAHLPRAFAQDGLERIGVLDARHHRTDERGYLDLVAARGFAFDDDGPSREMDRHVEGLAALEQAEREDAFKRIVAAQVRGAVAQRAHRVGQEQFVERATE